MSDYCLHYVLCCYIAVINPFHSASPLLFNAVDLTGTASSM